MTSWAINSFSSGGAFGGQLEIYKEPPSDDDLSVGNNGSDVLDVLLLFFFEI